MFIRTLPTFKLHNTAFAIKVNVTVVVVMVMVFIIPFESIKKLITKYLWYSIPWFHQTLWAWAPKDGHFMLACRYEALIGLAEFDRPVVIMVMIVSMFRNLWWILSVFDPFLHPAFAVVITQCWKITHYYDHMCTWLQIRLDLTSNWWHNWLVSTLLMILNF